MDDNVRNAWISAGKFLQEGNALSSMKLVDSPHYKVRSCKDGLVSICVIWFKTNHSLNLQTHIHLYIYLLYCLQSTALYLAQNVAVKVSNNCINIYNFFFTG